ncbi:hypothetical protein [Halopseudomonas maritima]|uniref:hypothetical protein n=1 Tax=Halopseudomonas maritima TaxID=2918528 RepID=UPI001EECBCC9|nr:hypothetical protein [Halopseudomonas maritima]UJJ31713.1 hypothetical protein HV822_00560 [Halopseudomonas maritima]
MTMVGTLLTLLILLIVVTWLYSRRRRRREQQQARRIALQQIRLLRQLIEQVQRRRGLSYGVQSGERALEARLWSVDQQVRQLFECCRPHQPTLHWLAGWHQALQLWERVEQADDAVAPEHLLGLQTELVQALLDTIAALAERFDLVCLGRLAPQAEGQWLELLQNIELLGQARAIGTGIAANRQNLPVWRARLAQLSSRVNEQCYAALARLVSDPALRPLLDQPVRAAEEALDVLLQHIRELLEQQPAALRSADYFQIATQAISAQLLLVDLLLERLEQSGTTPD